MAGCLKCRNCDNIVPEDYGSGHNCMNCGGINWEHYRLMRCRNCGNIVSEDIAGYHNCRDCGGNNWEDTE